VLLPIVLVVSVAFLIIGFALRVCRCHVHHDVGAVIDAEPPNKLLARRRRRFRATVSRPKRRDIAATPPAAL
jgi:hypothetical protein